MLAQGRLKDFGPLLAIWGAAMLVLVGPTIWAVRFSTSGSSWRCSTSPRRRPGSSAPAWRSSSRARRSCTRRTRVETAVTIWLHPWSDEKVYCAQTGGMPATGLRLVPARQVAVLDRRTAASAARASARAHSPTRAATPLIPYLNTDFIYSALAQELGLIGVAACCSIMLFCLRGFRIALLAAGRVLEAARPRADVRLRAPDVHHRRRRPAADPVTGITLPFVSYGGSSIVANFVLLAGSCSSRTEPTRHHGELVMNKQIQGGRVAALVLLASLIVATTYWQA